MQESYRKRVANHPDPGPREGSRNAALELKRWPGAYVGWVSLKLMSSEIAMGADGVRPTGRQHGSVRKQREHVASLRSRRPHARIETGGRLGTREPRDPVAFRSR